MLLFGELFLFSPGVPAGPGKPTDCETVPRESGRTVFENHLAPPQILIHLRCDTNSFKTCIERERRFLSLCIFPAIEKRFHYLKRRQDKQVGRG